MHSIFTLTMEGKHKEMIEQQWTWTQFRLSENNPDKTLKSFTTLQASLSKHTPSSSSILIQETEPDLQTPSHVRYSNDVKFFQGNPNSTPKTLQQHPFLSFPFRSISQPLLFLYSFLLHRFYYSPKTLLGLFASENWSHSL